MIPGTWHGYRETLQNLLEGFQIIDREWTYLYVNPAAAGHARLSPDDMHGKKLWEMFPGIEKTPLFATFESCMRERKAASFEYLFTFPDERTRWFDIRVEPVPEGICVLSVDIEARKAAEIALREQERMATLGQMAAVVAHEVKNPLAGLSGALQVLRARLAAGDPEIALFDEMLSSIRSLDRLIQDLLVFARPIQIEPRSVSIADVVREAMLLLNEPALTGHAVKLWVDEHVPLVRGDPALLKNVFRNLLLNAAQAMPEGGSIDVRVMRQEAMCRVMIADTGPGIPPAISSRVFEPFVTGNKGGTGLGLSISRRIMRLHGGELELQSTGAGGSVFLATVPLAAGTAEP